MSPVHRYCVSGPVKIDIRLIEEIEAVAMIDCDWLDPGEAEAVRRLRGWHRTRYGSVTVDAFWLADVRNFLDDLLGLGSECDEELKAAEYDRALYAKVKARITEDGYCGDCQWCRSLSLRDQCDTILDAAGYDGGSRYRAYCLDGEDQDHGGRR
jgi:hypothetical protein